MHALSALAVLLLASLLASPAYAAEKIYKSVDEKGNVIYSDKPLPGKAKSKSIAVPPPPSPEEVRRAEEEARKTKEKADAMEAERKAREQEREREQAVTAPAPETRSGPSDAAKATGISEHPRLDPEELEKYHKDQSYVPKPPAPPAPNPPPQ